MKMKQFKVVVGYQKEKVLSENERFIRVIEENGNEFSIGYDNNGDLYLRTQGRLGIEPMASNSIVIKDVE
jgi:hypothetical protein